MSDHDEVRELLRTLPADEPPVQIHTGDLIYEGRLALRRRRRWQWAVTAATAIVAVGVVLGAVPLLFPLEPESGIAGFIAPSATPSEENPATPNAAPVWPPPGWSAPRDRAADEVYNRNLLVMFEHLDPARTHLRFSAFNGGSGLPIGEASLTGKWKEGSREAYTVLGMYRRYPRSSSVPGGGYFNGRFCGPLPTDLTWTSCDMRQLSDGSELRVGEALAAGRTMALTATHVRPDGTRISVTFALDKNSPETALSRLPFSADDLVEVATDPRISLQPS